MSRASTPTGSTSRLGAASSQPQASISKPPSPNQTLTPTLSATLTPTPMPSTGPHPSRCRIVKHIDTGKGCPGWPWWMELDVEVPGNRAGEEPGTWKKNQSVFARPE